LWALEGVPGSFFGHKAHVSPGGISR
jgi:hypothetical protein